MEISMEVNGIRMSTEELRELYFKLKDLFEVSEYIPIVYPRGPVIPLDEYLPMQPYYTTEVT